jgi:hypothetical protein
MSGKLRGRSSANTAVLLPRNGGVHPGRVDFPRTGDYPGYGAEGPTERTVGCPEGSAAVP